MIPPALSPSLASRLALAPLSHVTREFPNKLDHVLARPQDALTPRALHPIFYGSFDWHSCVHGWWTLFTLYRLCPALPEARAIRALAEATFTPAAVSGEMAYLARPESAGFERPYGWAWLLMLAAELRRHVTAEGRGWAAAIQPLADAFADRFRAFLPRSPYPVRVGTHTNTAFALRLALEYAREAGDTPLADLCRGKALAWYQGDRDCQAWEPSQDEFLSPALMEAELMRVVLEAQAFRDWFEGFLPRFASGHPETLFAVPQVTDRTDGKIAHLDGLSLSRAWCLKGLAAAFGEDDGRCALALQAADEHLAAALPHMDDDYMGQHWLASFALLALADDRAAMA